MDTLRFEGKITPGSGLFSKQLGVPGKKDILKTIRDWPETLQPGSLNISIEKYSEEFIKRFGVGDVRFLDSREFLPEAELPFEAIKNNTLPPTDLCPDRGRAQIWRADLIPNNTGASKQCWVLRRIGSSLPQVLECVSEAKLRTLLSLCDADPVTLMVEGNWKNI